MNAPAASSQRAVLRDARAECTRADARSGGLGTEPSGLEPASRVAITPAAAKHSTGVSRPLRTSSSLGALHAGKRLGVGPHHGALSLSMQGQAAAVGASAVVDLEGGAPSALPTAHDGDAIASASVAASPTAGLPPPAAPWAASSALPSLGAGGGLQPPAQGCGHAAASTAHGQPPQPMAARRAARSTPPSVSLLRHRIKLEQLKDEQRQQLMALEPHNGQVLGRGEGAGAKASALYAAPTPQLSAPVVGVGGAGGPNNENHHTQMEAHSGKDPRRDAHGGYNTPSIYTADRGYTSATGIGGAAPMGAGSAISASLKGGNAGNAASYARAQRFMRRTGSRNGGPPTPTPFQNVKVFDLNVSGAAVGA